MTIDEVMDQFPVSRAQVKAVLELAARRRLPEIAATVAVATRGSFVELEIPID